MNYWDNLMASDEGAAQYMETYGEGPGSETRFKLASFIKEGESVLDVGCGPGWNLDHFKQHGPKIRAYRGLDYSERFVKVANARHDAQNVRFRVGDCRKLKEPDKSWDVVILQDVLEHTNGYEGPVVEALRVAKNRVIVTFWRLADNGHDQINDDGDDGWGATYDRELWENFLDSLPYEWITTQTNSNRHHDYYVINKEVHHESE